MKRLFTLAVISVISFSLLTSCGKAAENGSSSSASSQSTSLEEPEKSSAVIFIGEGESFDEYPLEYEGAITPEALIDEMSKLTGWNLDLAAEVYTEDNKMTVSFADTSALFTGPPEKQNDEFFVYDAEQLCSEILDSVMRTLQYNFKDDKFEDTQDTEIYYCAKEGEPIVLENIGITVPADKPYIGWEELKKDKAGEIEDEVFTAWCEYEGLADSHSAEVIINGDVEVLQFYSNDVYNALSKMEIGDGFSCQYTVDKENETKTILKIGG